MSDIQSLWYVFFICRFRLSFHLTFGICPFCVHFLVGSWKMTPLMTKFFFCMTFGRTANSFDWFLLFDINFLLVFSPDRWITLQQQDAFLVYKIETRSKYSNFNSMTSNEMVDSNQFHMQRFEIDDNLFYSIHIRIHGRTLWWW